MSVMPTQNVVIQRAGMVGCELEMVAAKGRSCESSGVQDLFANLHAQRNSNGRPSLLKGGANRPTGVITGEVFSSIDNGYNNLESSIGPVSSQIALDGSQLNSIGRIIHSELTEIVDTILLEQGSILNFSEHPNVFINQNFYRSMRAPKPIYDYWVDHRGWKHWVGIDAKAQNGANVDIPVNEAVRALNMALALAPAFIALFANSPFEAGSATGLRENRLTIWPRMFAQATFLGDRVQHLLPERPFEDFGSYLRWMFGPGTTMQTVPIGLGLDYKGLADVALIDGDPSCLEFLARPVSFGRNLATGERILVEPNGHHLEFLQFSHFLDARIRWKFAEPPSARDILDALECKGGIEQLFASSLQHCYIEMRAPGANYPDAGSIGIFGERTSATMALAPTALTFGLVRNLERAEDLVASYGWKTLAAMRQPAIVQALSDKDDVFSLRRLCRRVIEVASDGLEPVDRWMLDYPRFVVESGHSGADRALQRFRELPGTDQERLVRLMQERMVVRLPMPSELGTPMQQTRRVSSGPHHEENDQLRAVVGRS